MAPRYAIYFSPEPDSTLDAFGRSWFGNPKAAGTAVPGVSPARLKELTDGPRRYSFHGTLKPPFELNPSSTLEGLLAAAQVFARSLSPVDIPPLEMAVIGKFIALTPITSSVALENLAAACVRAFEGFRSPLNEEEFKSYQLNKLTVHQEQMLEHWGYPYVMEEFRFHMPITDRIDDDGERAAVMQILAALVAPVLNRPIRISDICVLEQSSRDAPMTLKQRFPFGRKQ